VWDRVNGELDDNDLDAVAAAEVRFWVVGPDRQPADVDPDLVDVAVRMDRAALAAEAALDQVDVWDLQPPALGRLGEVAVPVLIMAGAADFLEIRTLADRLGAELPHARLLPDVPNAGHLLPLEQPELAATAVLDFLAEVG
jgi:3-oxoadipate enol-lactonase